jgi:hypothetical protein
MHSWTRIARIACIGALASLLGGCMVRSKLPLIPESAMPDDLAGSYQVTGAMDARTMRKLPRAERAKCFDPGYIGQPLTLGAAPRGKPVRIYYCGYDPEKKKPLATTRIERAANGFLIYDEDGKPGQLRLKTIHPDLYLSQLEGKGEGDQAGFDYLLLRTRAGNAEFVPMFCQDFPSAPSKPVTFLTPLDGKEVTVAPDASADSPKECEITSLESIRADLDAFVARVDSGNAPPLIILRRLPE